MKTNPRWKSLQAGTLLPHTALRVLLLSAVAAAGLSGNAWAANVTWIGGGADANWGTAGNWSATLAASSSLFFDGSTQLTNVNNTTASTKYNGITFNSGAGAFSMSGNAIQLGGNITDNSTSL